MRLRFHFILYKSSDGQYYFVLRSKNNKVVMTSETYKSKQGAKKGITAIQNAFFLDGIFDEIDKTDD